MKCPGRALRAGRAGQSLTVRGWRCRHPFPAQDIGSHARFRQRTVRDWARLARYVVPIAARAPSRDACPGIRWQVRFEFVRLHPGSLVPDCRWPVRFEFVPGSPGQGKSNFVPGPRDKTHVPGLVTREAGGIVQAEVRFEWPNSILVRVCIRVTNPGTCNLTRGPGTKSDLPCPGDPGTNSNWTCQRHPGTSDRG